jgi:two-component system, cell cycle sensor histidine kinase and response regulator CckA
METNQEESYLNLSHSEKKSRTILLVEDESTSRNLIIGALRAEGYHVIETANGLKGLALYIEHRESIDLVISEVKTPEMSGWELASRINNIQPETKLLLISAYKHTETPRTSSNELNMAFLQKPFTMATLISKVETLLDRRVTSYDDHALLLI